MCEIVYPEIGDGSTGGDGERETFRGRELREL